MLSFLLLFITNCIIIFLTHYRTYVLFLYFLPNIHSIKEGDIMNKLSKLFDLVESENIDFFFANLKLVNKLGLYSCKDGYNVIVIDYTLKYNKIKLTEVLAEELGHHFTTVGDISNINTYQDMLKHNKVENKALKWATEFLISEDEICNLVLEDIKAEEMAERCEVSLEFFLKRLEFLSKKKNFLKLSNGSVLVLTNLPVFYVC